jgi:hypothetical protein
MIIAPKIASVWIDAKKGLLFIGILLLLLVSLTLHLRASMRAVLMAAGYLECHRNRIENIKKGSCDSSLFRIFSPRRTGRLIYAQTLGNVRLSVNSKERSYLTILEGISVI